jgi:hypothetical protein
MSQQIYASEIIGRTQILYDLIDFKIEEQTLSHISFKIVPKQKNLLDIGD